MPIEARILKKTKKGENLCYNSKEFLLQDVEEC
jgi:hypothetical protein